MATSPSQPLGIDSEDKVLSAVDGRLLREDLASFDEHTVSALRRAQSELNYATPVIVIANPAAGERRAQLELDSVVVPLLASTAFCKPVETWLTSQPGDAKQFGIDLRNKATSAQTLLVILIGGDGTTQEFLQGLCMPLDQPIISGLLQYSLAIIPTGTANALYHYHFPHALGNKYLSLASSLQAHNKTTPLPLLSVHINGSSHLAHVVASTALHASILQDSEQLRQTIPGIERFKKAAEINWTRVYQGSLQLSGQVQRYDPNSKSFIHATNEQVSSDEWVYLNACLTDRLEPTFIVAPLRTPAQSDCMDVVFIRKPKNVSQQQFSAALAVVTAAMYDGGQHINLVWREDHTVGPYTQQTPGPSVVDYGRCKTLTWSPVSPSCFFLFGARIL